MNRMPILLATLCLVTSVQVGAQTGLASPNYNWVHKYGAAGTAIEEGRAIGRSWNGTEWLTYVAGTFTGSITLGGTTYANSGGRDIFIVRLNSAGTILNSAKFGGALNDVVYDLTCSVSHTGATAGVYLVGESGGKMLMLKYPMDLTGAPVASGLNTVLGAVKGVSVSFGSLFVTGQLDPADFITFNRGNGPEEMTSNGGSCGGGADPDRPGAQGNMFVARLNTNLQVVNAVQPFTSGCSVGNDITVPSGSSRVYVCGSFMSNLAFNINAASQIVASGTRDMFVCSLNAPTAGTTLSFNNNDQQRGGGPGTETGGGVFTDVAYSIGFSNADVYVGGRCSSSASFGANPLVQQGGPFLVKYTIAAGAILQPASWVSSMNNGAGLGFGSQGPMSAIYGLSVSGTRVWVTGAIRNWGSLKAGSGSDRTFSGTGTNSAPVGLLASYNSDGSILWADQIKRNWSSSDLGEPIGRAINIEGCNLMYTGGITGTPFQFGNAPLTVNAANGDAFVARTTSQFAMPLNATIAVPPGSSTTINPTVAYPNATGWSWSVSPPTFFGGANTATPNISLTTPGTYTVTCTVTGGSCPATGSTKYTLVNTPAQGGGQRSPDDEGSGLTGTPTPRIYPNPGQGMIWVSGVDLSGVATVFEVFDAMGRRCIAQQLTSTGPIDLASAGLKDGVYSILIRQNDSVLLNERVVISPR